MSKPRLCLAARVPPDVATGHTLGNPLFGRPSQHETMEGKEHQPCLAKATIPIHKSELDEMTNQRNNELFRRFMIIGNALRNAKTGS